MFSPGQVSIYEIENIKSRRGNKILVCSEEKGAHSSEILSKRFMLWGKVKVAQKIIKIITLIIESPEFLVLGN